MKKIMVFVALMMVLSLGFVRAEEVMEQPKTETTENVHNHAEMKEHMKEHMKGRIKHRKEMRAKRRAERRERRQERREEHKEHHASQTQGEHKE